ncbi:MAG TPA: TonB-dependent receptor [Sphingomicrobium sp.]|jgi:iron complex outermembrane receptor protein
MIRRKHFCACVSVTALATVLCSGPAAAADQPVAPDQNAASDQPADQPAPATDTAATTNSGGDTTIIVTAQKRSENVQNVPISVAAFSGQTLVKSNVTDISQIGKLASNYQATKSVQSSFMRVNIRGIGAIGNTTIEPSVAIFVDGAYVPRAGAVVSSLLDIESVEVLRGPQGTLFGRNASVGALSLHSAPPRLHDLSARATGEIGTGDRYKIDGYVNVPVGESAAFRFAGMHQWFGGYWHNKLDGKQYGGTDDTVLRGSFRAQAGAFDWVFRADYSKIKGDGIPDIELDKDSINAVQLTRLENLLAGGPDTNFNDRNFNQFVTADLHDRQWGLNSTLSWDVGGGSTLRLIDSYRDWKNTQLDGDVVFSPAPVISRSGNFASKSQNHELQFISPTKTWLNGHFDMVAGLYYFREKYNLGENFHLNSQYCNVAFFPPVAPFTGLKTACNAFLTSVGGSLENATDQDVFQKVDSFAGYAQGNVYLNDKIFATLGGRYTKDKKEGTYEQTANPFIGRGIFRAPEALTFPDLDQGRFTYRAGLNYQATKDHLFYASYSTGYKSGGYNSGGSALPLSTFDANGNLVSTKRIFDRETVNDWELGAKTSWLDHKLTLNLNFYRMDISGYQDRAFDGVSFTVLNAGKLRQQGFEFDGLARPFGGLSLFASVAYLDSNFLDYPNAPGLPGCATPSAVCAAAGLGSTQDLQGKPAPNSPKWSGRLGFDWTGDLGWNGLTWDATSNLSFFSKQYEGIITDANPQTIEPSYAVLGARFSVSGPRDRWTASIFGNNLLDKQYGLANLYQPLDSSMLLRNGIFPGSTAVRRQHADPRTVGASLTVRY